MATTSSFVATLLLCIGCLTVAGCRPRPPASSPNSTSSSLLDSDAETVDSEKKSSRAAAENLMSIQQSPFGTLPSGERVTLFTCTNQHGLVLKMIDYGAIVVAVEVPDRHGRLANVTLGFQGLDGYLQRHPYFGATVGRFCNRIARGKFSLDGTEFQLATNDGDHHLHGGTKGFDRAIWQVKPAQTDNSVGLVFSYTSPDGEEGYPGNLSVTAEYRLTNDDELRIEFAASTDRATPVNLTNHCYWNLGGDDAGTILDHELMLAADKFVAVDDSLIPTGELADVDGTPLDFTSPKRIGQDIDQVKLNPQGYDHCFVLRSWDGSLKLAARVRHVETGRVMEVYTTQPSVQFYTGNFLDGQPVNGNYARHTGFCLETQHFPDSPNHPRFPSTILRPGEKFEQVTVFKFLVE